MPVTTEMTADTAGWNPPEASSDFNFSGQEPLSEPQMFNDYGDDIPIIEASRRGGMGGDRGGFSGGTAGDNGGFSGDNYDTGLTD